VAFSSEDIHEEFQRATFGTGDGSLTCEKIYKAMNEGLDVQGYCVPPITTPTVNEDGLVRGPEGRWLKEAECWEDDYSEESCP